MPMFCDAKFAAFNDRLKLNETRAGRIESAISAFKNFCKGDEQLSTALAEEPFLQGSVATRTAIRPLTNEEFDVDVIYPFTLSVFKKQPTQKQVIDWFISRLELNDFYKSNLIKKPRCARINYAGDFHVDFIPSTKDLTDFQPYAVPTRDLSNWTTNDPRGFARWVEKRDEWSEGVDADGVGRFVRSVRIMKRWRDLVFGEHSRVSSILLVTMLGKHEPTLPYTPPLEYRYYFEHKNDAAYLYDMLRLTHSCLQTPANDAFKNPTLPNEDLARGWDKEFLDLFLQRLGTCIKHMQNAFGAATEDDAVKHFQKAFGGNFP